VQLKIEYVLKAAKDLKIKLLEYSRVKTAQLL
jgi:hypothetical protein